MKIDQEILNDVQAISEYRSDSNLASLAKAVLAIIKHIEKEKDYQRDPILDDE